MKRETKYIVVFIAIVCLLTPLGLIAEGPAWGEWSVEEFRAMIGFVPESIEKATPLIKPLIPDYEVDCIGGVASSIFSAFFGTLICVGVIWVIKRRSLV